MMNNKQLNADTFKFSTPLYSEVLKHYVGAYKLPRSEPYPDFNGFPSPLKNKYEKIMEKTMESCAFNMAIAGVAGAGIGCVLGLLTFGVESPATTDPSKVPTVRETLTEMKAKCKSSAKTFATISCIFSCTECIIEKSRGKSDWKNGTYSGFVTGALLGLRAGLKPGIYGGISFALFSTAIAYYFNMR